MDVVSICPLRVASLVWQPRAGAWAITVVCKATFQLQPGVSPLAEVQEAPAEHDGHWDADEARSLHVPSDLVPFKARADVLLVGHAFAPGGQPVRSLPVRLAVGTVDKRVEVWCDRIFWHEGRLLEGQPFARMPLRWERAAGGPGTANPVGMRFDAPPDAHGAVPIPNLQPPGVNVARRGDTFAPIGLGPLAPGWPGRVTRLGRHAGGWSHHQWRERPLPSDLDRAYFNVAPPDQQVDAIDPDEPIVLENLHPAHPRLETRLAGVAPIARMTAGGRAGEELALVADTLWIDTDRALATVVWRGRVPLAYAAEEGCVTVSMKGAGLPGAVASESTVEGGAAGRALPFGEAQASTATVLGGMAGPALPFGPSKSPWEAPKPPSRSEPAPPPADTGTVYGVRLPAGDVLPFPTAEAPLPVLRLDPVPPPRIEPIPPPRIEPIPPPRIEPIPPAEIEDEETPPAPAPPAPASAPSAPAEGATAAPVEAPEPAAETPPVEIPLEQCAAIAASIARRPDDKAKILEESRLDAASYAAAEKRWNDALKEEMGRGRQDLLRVYDAAYVGRLEEERGPIAVAEYARLVAAGERGKVPEVLAELGLPRGAKVRIERVWLKKMLADPAVGTAARKAVKAARQA